MSPAGADKIVGALRRHWGKRVAVAVVGQQSDAVGGAATEVELITIRKKKGRRMRI